MVLGDADPVEANLVSEERLVHRLTHRSAAGLAVAQDGGRRPGVVRPWPRVCHGDEEFTSRPRAPTPRAGEPAGCQSWRRLRVRHPTRPRTAAEWRGGNPNGFQSAIFPT